MLKSLTGTVRKLLESEALDKIVDELEKEREAVKEALSKPPWVALKAKGFSQAWWIPEFCFVLNQAAMNWNYWQFSIQPFRSDKTMLHKNPDGVGIDFKWNSINQGSGPHDMTMDQLKKVERIAQNQPTIEEFVKSQLALFEGHFNVQIPDNVKSQIIADAKKAAPRRWSVNRLRTKVMVYPFDGSKKFEK